MTDDDLDTGAMRATAARLLVAGADDERARREGAAQLQLAADGIDRLRAGRWQDDVVVPPSALSIPGDARQRLVFAEELDDGAGGDGGT